MRAPQRAVKNVSKQGLTMVNLLLLAVDSAATATCTLSNNKKCCFCILECAVVVLGGWVP
jgi:hypothetical protein